MREIELRVAAERMTFSSRRGRRRWCACRRVTGHRPARSPPGPVPRAGTARDEGRLLRTYDRPHSANVSCDRRSPTPVRRERSARAAGEATREKGAALLLVALAAVAGTAADLGTVMPGSCEDGCRSSRRVRRRSSSSGSVGSRRAPGRPRLPPRRRASVRAAREPDRDVVTTEPCFRPARPLAHAWRRSTVHVAARRSRDIDTAAHAVTWSVWVRHARRRRVAAGRRARVLGAHSAR